MNLLWHQLKKDLLRTRLLVGLWLFFSLLQFCLVGASANPSDIANQMLLSMLAVLTSLLGSLLVIILVPMVVQQEPLVGTTAFWLTRPLSRRLLLAEKSLFLLGLILLPLLVQSVVMLANGVTLHDALLAAPEFVMGEAAWFLTMAMLAVLTPGFGRYVIACALYLIFLLVVVYLFQIFHLFGGSPFVNISPSLAASRGFISGIVTILFATAVILCQFFWRRHGVAMGLAIVGIAASSVVSQVWPWNLFQPPPLIQPDPAFDAAAVTLKPEGTITGSEQVNFRGAEPDKQYNANFDTTGASPGFLLKAEKFDVTLMTDSGSAIPVLPPGNSFFFNNQANAELLRPVLGDVPVVNLSPRVISTWSLFTVPNATYQRYAHTPAKLSMQAHLMASKYVASTEFPVKKGAEFRRGSYREEITDVLHVTDGVDILLQVQDVRLNYHLRSDQDQTTSLQPNRNDVIYLLVNRKRKEAVIQKQNNGIMNFINFNVSQALQHTPERISFGPEGNNSTTDWTFPKIDDAWLSDAVLMRIELRPVAEFVKPIIVGNFQLDGQYKVPGQTFEPQTPDLDTLAKITLPPNATREQVRDYIAAILAASQGANGSIDEHDPQVGMLDAVGAENLDLLAAAARDTHNYYLNRAIDHLAQPDQKAMIVADLPTNTDLISTIVHHGWQADARETLIAGLEANKGDPNIPRSGNQPFSYIGTPWIQAVAAFQDPATYPALREYFVNHSDAFTYKILAALPGFDSAGALQEAWAKAQSPGREMWRVGNLLPLAAQAGYPDVPATLLKLLSDKNGRYPYPHQIARRIAHQFTPAVGKTDDELAAWFKANGANLVFDPAQKKYVLAAAPPPVNPATPATMPSPMPTAPPVPGFATNSAPTNAAVPASPVSPPAPTNTAPAAASPVPPAK
jgi:hypothetical protein